jgi:PAS domain S-box-containing protein
MADAAPVLVWMSGVDRKRTWFNRQWLEFVGRPMEKEIGDGWADNVHPDDLERCVGTYVTSFDARRQFSVVYRLRRHDGEYRWILDNGVPLLNPQGEFTGYIGSCVDITDRTRAERALQSTQERFSRFMQHLPGLAWIKDVQGRYEFANDSALKAFGIPRDALYGRTDAQVFPQDVADTFLANDRRALENGVGVQTVEVLEHEDGVLHHSIVSKFPIRGPAGDAAWVGGIAIDITERKRAEEALREADRRKTDFLATLSHELRNPLAPIRNSLELVRHAGTDPVTIRKSLDVMDRQITHMVRLVDDLLDVSRITQDRLELRKRPVELSEVLHQAVETCRGQADRLGHTIDVVLPAAAIHLDADPVRLVQVFSNLLNNACKYSDRPGCIRIVATTDGTNATVSVADDGIGIPAGSLEAIFEMFAQVDSASESSRGSLGIGLTLVKRLVELHGGSVEARSDGIGRGSEFVVRLPVGQGQPVPAARPSAPVGQSPAPLRVLVVDDNEDSAMSLATLLQLDGHTTLTAHDGPQALEAADQFLPDVAILDVGLPTLSGHDVCRHLRERSWGRSVFIVALTGWGQEEDRRKSRDAGFDDHYVKPVDHSELLNRLRSVAQDRRPAAP